MTNNKNGLGFFGWSKSEKSDDQKKRANSEIDTFIANSKVAFGIADIGFGTPKIFTKAVNDYLNVLTDAKYYSDGKPQYMVAVWDNRMIEEIGRFLTEAKGIADSSFDGTLEKIMDLAKEGKDWTGRKYKYQTPIYKLKVPITSLPTGGVTPQKQGGVTAEQLAEIMANQNNNVATVATVDTSNSGVKTAYVAGGILTVIGLIGALLASKFRNKNKS